MLEHMAVRTMKWRVGKFIPIIDRRVGEYFHVSQHL
jgi:hypothetical protein